MPTLQWLKEEFSYGYYSGNVLSVIPGLARLKEERLIGGSYRNIFKKAIFPYLESNSVVLELGPGKGSWTRAILKYIHQGTIHTIDFQDVTKWLKPEKYNGKLACHKVNDNSFSSIENNFFDFFWSFGVLCHNNEKNIREIFQNSLSKMKHGGVAIHQYGNWEKLNIYGWKKGGIPEKFQYLPDADIWWPRNTDEIISSLAEETGWIVLNSDLGLVKRDSIIAMKRP